MGNGEEGRVWIMGSGEEGKMTMGNGYFEKMVRKGSIDAILVLFYV